MSWGKGISRVGLWLVISVLIGAGAPYTSPRPAPRPGGISTPAQPQAVAPTTHPSTRAQEGGLGVVLQNLFRPQPSVETTEALPQVGTPQVATYDPRLAIARSPRPTLRPSNLATNQLPPEQPTSRRGSVCGVRQIKGTTAAAIPAKLPGCGLSNPVRITSVSGVRLTQASLMDCNTAKALNDWVRNGVKPAVGRRGGGVEAIKVVAHYACRTRNNQAGAKISEHGRGRAVDIAGFYLKNGELITVLNGWRDRRDGKLLRAMHMSACGPFGTVLGPEANRYHQDHFHFDTAHYRSGPYCR